MHDLIMFVAIVISGVLSAYVFQVWFILHTLRGANEQEKRDILTAWEEMPLIAAPFTLRMIRRWKLKAVDAAMAAERKLRNGEAKIQYTKDDPFYG